MYYFIINFLLRTYPLLLIQLQAIDYQLKNPQPSNPGIIFSPTTPMEHTAIESLHAALLTCWNHADAHGMAALFLPNGNAIGFDGSQMNGPDEIEADLAKVFTNHKTASYVWKVEEVRFLRDDCALLRAIVGMIPPEQETINPSVNAIQSLIAVRDAGTWKIALFQNTPAQFHGRPQLVENMTRQLSQLTASRSGKYPHHQ